MPQAIILAAVSTAFEVGALALTTGIAEGALFQTFAQTFAKHLIINAKLPAAVKERPR